MTRCHYCGESVLAAPANEAKGIATLHACAASMALIGRQREALLAGVAADLTVMLASATELHDARGNVTGYTIKNGALHRILGRMAGLGHPVVVPAPAKRPNAPSGDSHG